MATLPPQHDCWILQGPHETLTLQPGHTIDGIRLHSLHATDCVRLQSRLHGPQIVQAALHAGEHGPGSGLSLSAGKSRTDRFRNRNSLIADPPGTPDPDLQAEQPIVWALPPSPHRLGHQTAARNVRTLSRAALVVNESRYQLARAYGAVSREEWTRGGAGVCTRDGTASQPLLPGRAVVKELVP
jgi:hypothetical protein